MSALSLGESPISGGALARLAGNVLWPGAVQDFRHVATALGVRTAREFFQVKF
jgi:hypothetical protein